MSQAAFQQLAGQAPGFAGKTDIHARDLPAFFLGIGQEAPVAASDIQKAFAPLGKSLQSAELPAELILAREAGFLRGRGWREVLLVVNLGSKLFKDRPRIYEFEPACRASAQTESLMVHCKRNGLDGADRAENGFHFVKDGPGVRMAHIRLG